MADRQIQAERHLAGGPLQGGNRFGWRQFQQARGGGHRPKGTPCAVHVHAGPYAQTFAKAPGNLETGHQGRQGFPKTAIPRQTERQGGGEGMQARPAMGAGQALARLVRPRRRPSSMVRSAD